MWRRSSASDAVSVFLPAGGKTYRYDFIWQKKRYTGTTHQLAKEDAALVEREIQLRLRHSAGGIAQFFPQETPRFQDWAEVYRRHVTRTLSRPDHVEHVLRVLLRFFGTQASAKEGEDAPRHDLRLGDVIARPALVLEFEDWMRHRGVSNQSKNHYRSVLRRLYALALQAEYVATTGVTANPFVGRPSDPTVERTVTLEPDQVRRLLAAASYHVRLALAIAALAPKLRLSTILALEWARDFDPDPRATEFNPNRPHYIRVLRHKTIRRTKRPQASPVSRQLLRILKDAHARDPRSASVVTYRGGTIKSIRDGVKAAAEAAGIPYGRALEDGATFHTIRHTVASLIAEIEDDPLKQRDVMGHGDLRTTLKYRHRRPRQEKPAIERLSRLLPIEAIVTAPRRRASRKPGAVGEVVEERKTTRRNRPKTPHKRHTPARRRK